MSSLSNNTSKSRTKKRRLSEVYNIFQNLPPDEKELYNNSDRREILRQQKLAFEENRKKKRAQSLKSNSNSSSRVLQPIQPPNQISRQLSTQLPKYKPIELPVQDPNSLDLFEQFCNKYEMKKYEKDIFFKYTDTNLDLLYELSELVMKPHNKSTKISFDEIINKHFTHTSIIDIFINIQLIKKGFTDKFNLYYSPSNTTSDEELYYERLDYYDPTGSLAINMNKYIEQARLNFIDKPTTTQIQKDTSTATYNQYKYRSVINIYNHLPYLISKCSNKTVLLIDLQNIAGLGKTINDSLKTKLPNYQTLANTTPVNRFYIIDLILTIIEKKYKGHIFPIFFTNNFVSTTSVGISKETKSLHIPYVCEGDFCLFNSMENAGEYDDIMLITTLLLLNITSKNINFYCFSYDAYKWWSDRPDNFTFVEFNSNCNIVPKLFTRDYKLLLMSKPILEHFNPEDFISQNTPQIKKAQANNLTEYNIIKHIAHTGTVKPQYSLTHKTRKPSIVTKKQKKGLMNLT